MAPSTSHPVFGAAFRKRLPLPALIILPLAISASIALTPIVMADKEKTVNITATKELTVWVGQSGSYQLTLHNGLHHKVTADLQAIFVRIPVGGSVSDITLTLPNHLTVLQGNTRVAVGFDVGDNATPGTYVITHNLLIAGVDD